MTFSEMTESQKAKFVQRWEKLRRRGAVWYIARTTALGVLLLTTLSVLDVQIGGPDYPDSPSTIADVLTDKGHWLMSLVFVLPVAVVFWFGGEEMYRNFK